MIQSKKTTTNHYSRLVKVLGVKYVKDKVESPYDFISIATRGLSSNVINNFGMYFNITKDSTARMLNVSAPKLYRLLKSDKKLDRNFTVKLFEIVDLFLFGEEVFDSRTNFFKWLRLPNTSLGGMEPQELIEIPGGISKVKGILGRIEHGVYS